MQEGTGALFRKLLEGETILKEEKKVAFGLSPYRKTDFDMGDFVTLLCFALFFLKKLRATG